MNKRQRKKQRKKEREAYQRVKLWRFASRYGNVLQSIPKNVEDLKFVGIDFGAIERRVLIDRLTDRPPYGTGLLNTHRQLFECEKWALVEHERLIAEGFVQDVMGMYVRKEEPSDRVT